jgi:preprotein translocase subunit SecG
MLLVLVTIVHVIVCFFLIVVVLLQSGSSADLASAFGGGMGSQTAFGPRSGASILTRLTTWSAIIFMLTSFTLAILSTRSASASGSVLGSGKVAPVQQTLPVNPAKK